MSQYLPKTCSHFELDLSNYETVIDVKKTIGVDISSFAKKSWFNYSKTICQLKVVSAYLSNLKSKLDKLDVDELKTVVIDLKVLLTLQLDISKILKEPYFNLFGKNYWFFHFLAFKSITKSRVI